ncbi:putative SnoaL-like domain-containing protein [Seiridium unicorne]|uniref:SnoaL-like domain-containing protein n=1 Tax=Seiridium unicorne TaxID=138068 RepID=A0ABR2UJV1_9PEZI
MATFEIYDVPASLTFQDYLAVCQCARTLADGYDRKEKPRLYAALVPGEVTVDYSNVVKEFGRITYKTPEFVDLWLGPQHMGVKALVTQHLMGIPYFKSVTDEEIVVEWHQLASHGRREKGGDYNNPMCKITETSDGRSWMQQVFVKHEGKWRIREIKPEALYHTGDWQQVRRQDEDEDKEESGS